MVVRHEGRLQQLSKLPQAEQVKHLVRLSGEELEQPAIDPWLEQVARELVRPVSAIRADLRRSIRNK